jgi:hypothetical protein
VLGEPQRHVTPEATTRAGDQGEHRLLAWVIRAAGHGAVLSR